MSELKPCPFCGGDAMMVHPSNADHFGYVHSSVRCKTRGCRGSEFELWRGTDDEAIAAWNTRAERTCENVKGDDCLSFECSQCHEGFSTDPTASASGWDTRGFRYCPHCGARVVKS